MPNIGTGKDLAALSRIAHRMEGQATSALGDDSGKELDLMRDPWQPRWRIDSAWVEFECGCRCERTSRLHTEYKAGDAVIFRGLAEQAVYDYVCSRHAPGMNKIVRFSGYADFAQWKKTRKHVLLGKTVAV